MSIKRKFRKGNLEYSPSMKVKQMTEDIYFKQIGKKNLQEVLFQKRQLPLWTETWIKNPVFRFKTLVKEEKISFLIFIKYPKKNWNKDTY